MLPALVPMAATAATVGTKCVKPGAVAWHGKIQLKCVKFGGRMQWRPARASTPKAGPQPDADSMVGATCVDEGNELLNAAGPIKCVDGSWASIALAEDSVASRAYRNLMVQYWMHPTSTVGLKMVSDSQTSFAIGPVERGIRAADRLWSVNGTMQPYPVVLAHDLTSLLAASGKLGLALSDTDREVVAAQERSLGDCVIAEFVTHVVNQPWMFFCMGRPATDDSDLSGGFAVGAHEYTHVAQFVLLGDIRGWRTYISMAPWFEEGLASYVMMALGGVAGDGGLRNSWVSNLESATGTVADYNYFVPTGARAPYALGLFATEALYALEGPGITEKILKAGSTGLKFSEAFKSATGNSLEDWTPVLEAYVESVKAQRVLSLTQLQDVRDSVFRKVG